MRILLTGFEPFDGAVRNESWESVRLVAADWDAESEGAELLAHLLPVTFVGAPARLRLLIDDERPEVVVCVGLAAGTEAVRLERVAINVVDARIPDNLGDQPVDVPVVAGGPDGYLSTLPLKRALVSLRDLGIPAAVSNTAGTYVCNAVFYAAQHATHGTTARSGFVHVPAAERLGVADAARALRVILRETVVTARERLAEPAVPAGAEH